MALQDTRGCLTTAGLEAMRRAPVGQAPQALAAHVGSCPRCQERLLALGAGLAPGEKRKRKRPPPLRRALILLAAGLLGLLASLAAMRRLLGD